MFPNKPVDISATNASSAPLPCVLVPLTMPNGQMVLCPMNTNVAGTQQMGLMSSMPTDYALACTPNKDPQTAGPSDDREKSSYCSENGLITPSYSCKLNGRMIKKEDFGIGEEFATPARTRSRVVITPSPSDKKRRTYRHWSAKSEQRLLALRGCGLTWKEIVHEMNSTMGTNYTWQAAQMHYLRYQKNLNDLREKVKEEHPGTDDVLKDLASAESRDECEEFPKKVAAKVASAIRSDWEDRFKRVNHIVGFQANLIDAEDLCLSSGDSELVKLYFEKMKTAKIDQNS